jgi:hypothetical protein
MGANTITAAQKNLTGVKISFRLDSVTSVTTNTINQINTITKNVLSNTDEKLVCITIDLSFTRHFYATNY